MSQSVRFHIELDDGNDYCEKQYYCPRKLFDAVNEAFGDEGLDISSEENEIIFYKDEYDEETKCKKYFLETNLPAQKNFKVVIIECFVVDEKFKYNNCSGKKIHFGIPKTIGCSLNTNFLLICSNKVIFAGTIYYGKNLDIDEHCFIPRNVAEEILFNAIAKNEIKLILHEVIRDDEFESDDEYNGESDDD